MNQNLQESTAQNPPIQTIQLQNLYAANVETTEELTCDYLKITVGECVRGYVAGAIESIIIDGEFSKQDDNGNIIPTPTAFFIIQYTDGFKRLSNSSAKLVGIIRDALATGKIEPLKTAIQIEYKGKSQGGKRQYDDWAVSLLQVKS